MTTASNDEVRDLNILLDLPYSNLTDDEIERVIEFKASIKARDQQHQERLAAIKAAGDALVAQAEADAREAKNRQMDLYNMSIARLKIARGEMMTNEQASE